MAISKVLLEHLHFQQKTKGEILGNTGENPTEARGVIKSIIYLFISDRWRLRLPSQIFGFPVSPHTAPVFPWKAVYAGMSNQPATRLVHAQSVNFRITSLRNTETPLLQG